MSKILSFVFVGVSMSLAAVYSLNLTDTALDAEFQTLEDASPNLTFMSGDITDGMIEVAHIIDFEGEVPPARVRLWGLTVQDGEAFSTLLSNRLMICKLLSQGNGEALGVCQTGLRPLDGQTGILLYSGESIFLLNWLPEFGVAQRQCTAQNTHNTSDFTTSTGGYFGCNRDGFSSTSIVIHETPVSNEIVF